LLCLRWRLPVTRTRVKSSDYLCFNGSERLRFLLLFVLFEVKVTCHPYESKKFRLPLLPWNWEVEVTFALCYVWGEGYLSHGREWKVQITFASMDLRGWGFFFSLLCLRWRVTCHPDESEKFRLALLLLKVRRWGYWGSFALGEKSVWGYLCLLWKCQVKVTFASREG
jgi:hypothetical protein